MMASPLLPFEVAEFRRRRRPAQGGRAWVYLVGIAAAILCLTLLGRCT